MTGHNQMMKMLAVATLGGLLPLFFCIATGRGDGNPLTALSLMIAGFMFTSLIQGFIVFIIRERARNLGSSCSYCHPGMYHYRGWGDYDNACDTHRRRHH